MFSGCLRTSRIVQRPSVGNAATKLTVQATLIANASREHCVQCLEGLYSTTSVEA